MATQLPSAKSIFDDAVEINSPAERQDYLDRACAGLPELRQKIEALLCAYEEAGSFLESPILAPALVATVDEPITEQPGTVIGPYKLLEQIGEGGFGVVFMAEQQQPIHRTVALKILKPGMDTRQVIARFEAERQALALMDHPNIAKVLDAGQTSGGRPYFVMDLVKGLPITEFCDQSQLTTNKRLELFVSVCQAVQHAHQKGIIHRDIKPSNVLVTLHDGTPVPKIIDFGIAKVLGQQLTDKSLHTGFAQLIGTPLYMAPEQAALSNADVDTRSDIYSLGVLLYELLTGTTPLDKERLREADFDEVCRIIREEEPPKPSTRISTLGQAATTISTQRKSEPKQLSRLLRGELDWIVMKCLEKDRNRRYETASAFAADVQHYLHDEPVQACPPSAWYKLRKFARRQKTALVIATCVFLALASMAGVVGWAARDRAASEETGARQAQEALTAARTFFGENRLDLARPKLAEAQALLGAHHVAPGSLADEIETLEAELVRFEQFFALIDQAHQAEIPSPDQVAVAGQGSGGTAAVLSRKPWQDREPAKAVPFLLKALALYEALEQKDWSTALEQGALGRRQVEQIRRTAYEELLWLADDLLARRQDHVSGEQLSAPAAARQALAYLDKAGAGHEPTTAFFSLRARCRGALGDKEAADADAQLARATPPRLALDHDLLGQAALDAKDKDVAVREFEEALRLEPTHYWSLMKLGQAFNALGEGPADFAAAVAVFTGCIMKRPDFAPAYRYRAGAHLSLKHHEKSLQDYSKAIALDPKDARSWNVRGGAYIDLHQYDKALADVNKAIELDPKLAGAWTNRGAAYNYLRQFDKALADLNKAIELDPKLKIARTHRGRAYYYLHRYDKALADYSKAIELVPNFAGAWSDRGTTYRALHQYDKALADLNKAIELDPKYVDAWNNRGAIYFDLHQYDKALADWTKAIELDPKYASSWNDLAWLFATCPDPRFRDAGKAVEFAKKAVELKPTEGDNWNTLGAAHYRAGESKLAVEALNKSMSLRKGGDSTDWFFLAMAHWRLGEKDKARQWYEKAVQWMEKNNPQDDELRRFRAEAEELLKMNDKKN
jgi:serine/threonine protein kinase/Flp pilus assembly protein TadD